LNRRGVDEMTADEGTVMIPVWPSVREMLKKKKKVEGHSNLSETILALKK